MAMRAHVRLVMCFAALGGAAATTVVRLTFTESRGDLGTCSPGAACDGDSCCKHGVSLSEVRLFSDAANLPIESITNPGGYNPIGEVPSKLIDGLTAGSKWLDLNFTTHSYSELIIVVDDSLGAPTSLELIAGNTPDKRDPVSWTVEVLDACGGFSEVLSVTQATAPDQRWSPYPEGPFALRALTPTDANLRNEQSHPAHFYRCQGRRRDRRRHAFGGMLTSHAQHLQALTPPPSPRPAS